MGYNSAVNNGNRKRAWREKLIEIYRKATGNDKLPRPLQFISLVDEDNEYCQMVNSKLFAPEQYLGVNWEKKPEQYGMVENLTRWYHKAGAEFEVGEISEVIRKRLAQGNLDAGFVNLDTCTEAPNSVKLCAKVMQDLDAWQPNGTIFLALNVVIDHMGRRMNRDHMYTENEILYMLSYTYKGFQTRIRLSLDNEEPKYVVFCDTPCNWVPYGRGYAYHSDGKSDMLTLFFIRREVKVKPPENNWLKQWYIDRMPRAKKAWATMHRNHRLHGKAYNQGRKKVIA